MYPMNNDFGRARIQQYERMIANSPPRGRERPHNLRAAVGRALVASGSRMIYGQRRVRVS